MTEDEAKQIFAGMSSAVLHETSDCEAQVALLRLRVDTVEGLYEALTESSMMKLCRRQMSTERHKHRDWLKAAVSKRDTNGCFYMMGAIELAGENIGWDSFMEPGFENIGEMTGFDLDRKIRQYEAIGKGFLKKAEVYRRVRRRVGDRKKVRECLTLEEYVEIYRTVYGGQPCETS